MTDDQPRRIPEEIMDRIVAKFMERDNKRRKREFWISLWKGTVKIIVMLVFLLFMFIGLPLAIYQLGLPDNIWFILYCISCLIIFFCSK
jgi:hypothetical protein